MAYHVKFLLLFLIAGALALAGCGKKGPEAISLGSDNCAGCGMTVMDARFGAELITRKGKVLKFDSVECLAGFLNRQGNEEAGSLWVVDFAHPSQLFDATKGYFLASEKLQSPMGLNLSAFRDRQAATAMQGRYTGTMLSWPEVLKYVAQRRG